MKIEQIRIEITNIINELTEEVLPDILNSLQQLRQQPTEKIRLSNQVRKILAEDKTLFKRLAR